MILYICTKFQENNSKDFTVINGDAACILLFSKGHNSVYSVGGVMVLILCTLSDGVVYLYHVLS